MLQNSTLYQHVTIFYSLTSVFNQTFLDQPVNKCTTCENTFICFQSKPVKVEMTRIMYNWLNSTKSMKCYLYSKRKWRHKGLRLKRLRSASRIFEVKRIVNTLFVLIFAHFRAKIKKAQKSVHILRANR